MKTHRAIPAKSHTHAALEGEQVVETSGIGALCLMCLRWKFGDTLYP